MDLGKKIFILIPDRQELSSIREQLEALNPSFKFETDYISERGLVTILHRQPDLLIADVEQGAISGFDLSEILRMIPSCACLSIVLLTPNGDNMFSQKAAASVADLHVQKGELLIAGIQKAIQQLLMEPEAAMELEKRPIKRVLVVDDSRTMRRITGMILAGIGIYEIIEAENGIEGLEKLNTQGADMIMLDYSMPRMNGLEMVKQVRKNLRFEKLPIVIATAEGLELVDAVLRAGANVYINKPFTMQHVRDVVTKFASNLK